MHRLENGSHMGDLIRRTVSYGTPLSAERSAAELHMHTSVELGVVTEGHGFLRYLSETVECRAGDVFLLDSGVSHGYFAGNNGEAPTVELLRFDPNRYFSGELADPQSERYCYGLFWDHIPVSYAFLNGAVTESLLLSLREISRELEERRMEWESRAGAHLILILTSLSRYVNLAEVSRPLRPKGWATVSAAVRQLSARYSESDLTLETVAASLYVSQAQLSRLFPTVTGSSFTDYLRALRIGEACRLLRYTELTNEEIAERCGLRDIPTFYRHFKNQTGMTPNRYRSTHAPAPTADADRKEELLSHISEQVRRGKPRAVCELGQQALDSGIPAHRILNEGLLVGMSAVGEQFKSGNAYVPEVLVAARAMNAGMLLLKPYLSGDKGQARGRVCIGTVQGDLHDIGKNLVKMMMEGKGLEVIDLGTDVAPEAFVEAVQQHGCRIVCCSALLSTTMGVIANVVKAIEAAGLRHHVKIMIGGAPVTEDFCRRVGADLYTPDAASAADAAAAFCNEWNQTDNEP